VDIEVIGLYSLIHSCRIHEVNGDFVEVGDLLGLVLTCAISNGKDECAIKLVRLMDEADRCTAAIIPCILMDLHHVKKSKFCMVKELY
jgi:hypothetical protein